jgi:hypothetical protein
MIDIDAQPGHGSSVLSVKCKKKEDKIMRWYCPILVAERSKREQEQTRLS